VNSRVGVAITPSVMALLLAMLMGLPILWLAGAAFTAAPGGGLGASMLPISLRDTGLLMLAVGALATAIGLVAAWLVAHYDFPGRAVFEWALMLPLAIPTYLAAYCFTELLDFTGPVQSLVRSVTGAGTVADYWFPQIRSFPGAVIVLSLVLYPYVYAACRAFFLMQSGTAHAAARALGATGWRAFWAVTVPMSRPALVVGATLAMMEVVNDLGAVQYFGINSLTAIIYSTWINRSNFGGAAQLAVTIVLVIAILILAERAARRAEGSVAPRDGRVADARIGLTGGRAAVAIAGCSVLLLAAFGLPAGQLLYLASRQLTVASVAMTSGPFVTTILLALAGASVTVAIGYFAAHLSRHPSRTARGAIRLAALGYAIPGTVLALGLLQPLGMADRAINSATRWAFGWTPGLILSGSTAALLYVYAIRFLAVSHSTLAEAITRRGPSMLDAGRVLGARGLNLFVRIDLPTLAPALAAAGTLVFVEIIKELPATLLLRPLGVETLATLVYAKANTVLFAEAALPALAIVAIGIVPVILATRLGARRKV
jgi:iron(III) transport system permease protein